MMTKPASHQERRLQLDLIVPTHNRASLLARLLESMLLASLPDSLDVHVIVVDNASRDETEETVRAFEARFRDRFGRPLTYLYEGRPGKSYALNLSVSTATGEIIGMVDDDEELGDRWFAELMVAFAQPGVDYITGPCIPAWEAPPPTWLIDPHDPALGLFDAGRAVRSMPDDYEGQMMGGNAAVRRALLLEVGGYDASLGPSERRRQLSCEDSEMHERLRRRGARGQYRPDFVIRHFVPRSRLEKRYHRRWHMWHGVSLGLLDRRTPPPVKHMLGIPRYMFREALRDLAAVLTGRSRRARCNAPRSGVRFAAFLRLVGFLGYCYGRCGYAAPDQDLQRGSMAQSTENTDRSD